MPFEKIGPDTYTHKGKKYTKKQVKAYYATDGFKRKPKRRHPAMEGLKKARP